MTDEIPANHPHYIFKNLKRIERWVINLVYFSVWRKYVKTAKLKINERKYFEHYFKELHVRYYLKVYQGGSYITADRLILNFLLSRVNENMRILLSSANPYIMAGFVSAIRSQIEINALANKYASDKSYHEKFI